MSEEITDVAVPARKVFLIADHETCGLGQDKKSCQVGLIEVDADLNILFEIESLIDPQWPISPGAAKIHGITDEMVANEPTMLEFVERRLKNRYADASITLICHNVAFDKDMTEPIGPIDRTICTLEEARAHIRGTANHKLQTLREHYGIPKNDAHQALADCHTTREVLRVIMQITGRTLDELATPRKRMIHYMPWGQHKDKLLKDVPTSYLQWMLRECEGLEQNLKDSVEAVLVLR